MKIHRLAIFAIGALLSGVLQANVSDADRRTIIERAGLLAYQGQYQLAVKEYQKVDQVLLELTNEQQRYFIESFYKSHAYEALEDALNDYLKNKSSFKTMLSLDSRYEYLKGLKKHVEYMHQYWTSLSVQDVHVEMVDIPGGTFRMECSDIRNQCSSDEFPIHEVTVQPFQMAATEVTYTLWDQCTLFGACKALWDEALMRPGIERARMPVALIDADDLRIFFNWLTQATGKNYRLPTETEWEYVTKAHKLTQFYWGDDLSGRCQYENTADRTYADAKLAFWTGDFYANKQRLRLLKDCEDDFGATTHVASFKPNPFGVFDLIGNVSEVTLACGEKPMNSDSTVSFMDTCKQFSNRGGSYEHGIDELRVSQRGHVSDVITVAPSIGFRLVLSQP